MILDILLSAIALWLIFEGILPTVSPQLARKLFHLASLKPDHVLRGFGLGCLILGAIVMTLVHSGII